MTNVIVIIIIIILLSCITITLKEKKKFNAESILNFDFTNSLRGIAILLVIVCHVGGNMNTRLFTPLGGIGVALFLFLSGYGLNESFKKNGLKHYWRKKVGRVLFPYFIIITIFWIFFSEREFGFTKYILDILGLKTSFWYIAFLMKWYIAFWTFTIIIPEYRGYALMTMGIIILLFSPNIEAQQAFSFLLGYYVSVNKEKFKQYSKCKFITIAICSFIYATIFLGIKQLPEIREFQDTCIYNLVQVNIKLPYAISISSIVAALPVISSSRFLLFTGGISYELYLIHMCYYSNVGSSLLRAIIFIIICYIIAYLFNTLNKMIIKITK